MFSPQAPIHFSEVEETFTEPPVVKHPRFSETAAAPLLTIRRVPPSLEPKGSFALEPTNFKAQQ